MIQVESVAKQYGEKVVLDDVDVTIAPGGITALVGANGAGKSTLLAVMSRLLQADSGSVSVDGMDVGRTDSKRLARHLAILRQENTLAVRLTVRDLVAFGRHPHSGGRLTIEDQRHIQQSLDYLNLGPLADCFLDEISGGQRQRAFVAMVLCQDTDYVLLDEPLNNLDMAHCVAILELLRRAADDLGKTIVIVLHDINAASAYADHIIAMSEGRVIAEGAPSEIMVPRQLEQIFGVPVDVRDIDGQLVCLPFPTRRCCAGACRCKEISVA
ncbi:ABC transporter ATP-binding protein [Blastococcus sp. Marseille-P5729]|uniref:iron ABC transporter ATP-binding protein n=1 Tax=Blastococcus sp. Marseille-P5729 TaxID=2086582 RepID=UPI000D0EFCD6|nr:ATP-binding cassette domain-containing protein [Blastococcus sp. Marseille-P5729]